MKDDASRFAQRQRSGDMRGCNFADTVADNGRGMNAP
jgi:hypothetical protein